MANHASAKKRIRQNEKRRIRNGSIRSRMRNTVRAARAAIESKAADHEAQLKEAVRVVYRAASQKVIKREAAQRTVSRLMKLAGRA